MANAIFCEASLGLTEAEAIARSKDGDANAFECLYKAYCKRVFSVCSRMIKHPGEAEELTQQVFLQVFRKIATFRGDSAFSTWLHRVTLNIVFMHLRRKKLPEVSVDELHEHLPGGDRPREFGAADNSMLGAIDRLHIKRAIDKLPHGYKRIFLLYDVLGYEHPEIAESLKCSVGNSKSQLHKARKRLQLLLKGEQNQVEDAVAST
jgi:RNA polymerase sigma-70 factor (ECF subfamily)